MTADNQTTELLPDRKGKAIKDFPDTIYAGRNRNGTRFWVSGNEPIGDTFAQYTRAPSPERAETVSELAYQIGLTITSAKAEPTTRVMMHVDYLTRIHDALSQQPTQPESDAVSDEPFGNPEELPAGEPTTLDWFNDFVSDLQEMGKIERSDYPKIKAVRKALSEKKQGGE